MNDKIFIRDVIYGLKHEYGEPIKIRRYSQSTNLDTGAVSREIITEVSIDKAVLLPFNIRATFAKTVGVSSLAYLEPGQREILIDNDDLGSHKLQIHDRVLIGTIEEEIIREPEVYDFGTMLVSAKA